MVRVGFSRLFLRGWCDGKGEAARSRLVDTRSEALGVEKRPFSRNFSKRRSQKRGGAKGGAPGYIRRTDESLGPFSWSSGVLVSWSALLVLWFMPSGLGLSCLWVCGATHSLEAWVGGKSGRRTGGAALPAVWREPARPCGERRRELAGHARGPGSGAATLAAVEMGRRDSPTTEGGR